ncbi:PepSY domain-containing protein [Pontibacter sp. SGAir0037]|uniref:PepSY-associated TM helix domain-containing protein n=1 Tax=Pontibacter sp. SGAir0037 TaxID=2571030 RepID=UPI0010CD254F|nr:PepSY-associated TM helix domain-containing protein [Pontibacter sp. SGAir0037]QCR23803.1 sulfite reductase [Pontibacter sp. SGAir0037]
MKKQYSIRKFFNDLHLWLGIGSGLVLFIVCLSGTVYTFRTEIEEMAEPEKYHAHVPADARPLKPELLVQQLEKELKGKVVSLSIPENKASTYQVGIRQEGKPAGAQGGGHGGGGRPKTYLVDPYTGVVKGSTDSPTSEFFTTVMKLHRWLLIEGDTGRIIVGISTIIFTFLLLSGLVLWFPAKLKNWKQNLKVKTNANWKRINHDLHNTLGFYAFLLLLIMSLTGLCWSFEWYKEGVSSVMGAEVFKGRGEKPLPSDPAQAGTTTLTLTDFIQKANTELPYEGDVRVSFPADSAGSYLVAKNKTGFFALAASDKIQLNQYTGEVLKAEIFADKPFNEQVVTLIRPLHLGDVFGTFSKILYFITCLIATTLPVTGTFIWINKLKKRNKKKAKAKLAVS